MSTKINGSFSATGTSAEHYLLRYFNVSLDFNSGTATVDLERSFDDGATWEIRQSFTSDESTAIFEPEKKVKYRLNCSAFTSGPVSYRIGTSGLS
jgi:hypothetical protein